MPTTTRTQTAKTIVRLRVPYNLKINVLSENITGRRGNHATVRNVCILYTYLINKGFSPKNDSGFGKSWAQVHSQVFRNIFGGAYARSIQNLLAAGYLERCEANPDTGEVNEQGYYRSPQSSGDGQAKMYRIPDRLLANAEGKKFKVLLEPEKKVGLKKLAAIRTPACRYPQEENRLRVAKAMQGNVLIDTPRNAAPLKPDSANAKERLEVFNNPLGEVFADGLGKRIHVKNTNLPKTLRPFIRFVGDGKTP